jgi:hypothetical protein
MSIRTGYLTIFSSDRTEIFGEFAGAEWTSEVTAGGTNYVFTGTASEGILETFLRLDSEAISHVAYTFELSGQIFSGDCELLAPIFNDPPLHTQIRFETGEAPVPS